ncbi:MAG: act protein [Deltaproteobacteria bacterium]|nr:act protein [Deltaproteobacteria bacterium]
MRSYVVISTMGSDRPGLAKEIAEFFTARGINIERSRGCVLGNEFGMIILQLRGVSIEDIATNVDNNPFTGANVFHMVCYFSLPPAVKIIDLKNDFNRISDEYNIDIRFDAVISK